MKSLCLAPVTAVRGNVDTAPWASALAETEILDVDGVRLYVIHDLAQLAIRPAASRIQVVVSGHSHQPVSDRKGGVLYLNPGSAGPRRFRLPIAIAELTIADGAVEARIEVQMRFELNIDGSLVGRPQAISPITNTLEQATASSVDRAIRNCAPFDLLPRDSYDTWRIIEATFRAQDSVN